MIAKNTTVRLRTTNGGDTIALLGSNYSPSSSSATLSIDGRHWFTIMHTRIKSMAEWPYPVNKAGPSAQEVPRDQQAASTA